MEKDYLYERPVKYDTETPRECHIRAMYSAYKGESIPSDVYDAVLSSAQIRKDTLKRTMDLVNQSADSGMGEKMSRLNMMALAGSIVASHGINGPKAAKRRLDHLGRYFLEYLLFLELGPTE